MNKAEKIEEEKKKQDAVYQKNKDASDNLNRAYIAFRREINSKTPEQKAQRLEMFNLLCWGITKEHQIPEDIKIKVIEIQTKFFEENPKRIYCSPVLFKSLFNEENKIFNPAIAVIERVVAKDMNMAKYN